jgi:hypothetical protein
MTPKLPARPRQGGDPSLAYNGTPNSLRERFTVRHDSVLNSECS